MLSGRICRACRLRLFGPRNQFPYVRQSTQAHQPEVRHGRYASTAAVSATTANHPPTARSETKPSSRTTYRTPWSRDKNSRVEGSSRASQRPARRARKPQKAYKGDVQEDSHPRLADQALPHRPLPEGNEDDPAKARATYRYIRSHWNIPYERSRTGRQLTHGRVMKYHKFFKKMKRRWAYLSIQLSEDEVRPARRHFERWYRRLGWILHESGRIPEGTAWRQDAAWLLECSNSPAMCTAWTKLDMDERRRRWPSIMLSAILTSPDRAMDVLAATLTPLPPGYAITDVLEFVATRLHTRWPKDQRESAEKADDVLHLMEELLLHVPEGHLRPSQHSLGLLAAKLPPQHVASIHKMLANANVRLTSNTALHFAAVLARHPDYKPAALGILLSSDMDMNEPKTASVITSLLHPNRQQPEEDSASVDASDFSKNALEALMRQGLVPNAITLTAFLDSLCADNKVDEAIRLVLLFAESGASFDSRTFSTIFRAAKETRDPVLIRRAFEVAKVTDTPVTSVLNNGLHMLFHDAEVMMRGTRSERRRQAEAFEMMLRLYIQKFHLEPLQALLPITLPLKLAKERLGPRSELETVVQDFFTATEVPRMMPDATTLSIMLRTYVRSLRDQFDIMTFYDFFKYKLENPTSNSSKLAKDIVWRRSQRTLIHDTVILTLLDCRGSTRQMLQVVGDMIQDNLPEKRERRKRAHPPPSIFTLAILISRLLRRGQQTVAEQLMGVMREQNLQPNLPMLNAMLKGHATLQDVPETVRLLQEVDRAGYKHDAYTYRAFGKLKDQDRALKMMDSIIQKNEGILAEEADELL